MTPVSALVGDTVAWIRAAATLFDVARKLVDADVGLLIVRDGDGSDDKPRGVVSERDLVHALAAGQDPAATCALDIAHTELSWSDADATVAEVAQEMMERYIRHVLVEEDGQLVGVVSMRDVLGTYAAADQFADDE